MRWRRDGPTGAGEMDVASNDSPWWDSRDESGTAVGEARYVPVHPPVPLLAAAGVAALASLLLWLPGRLLLHVAGYVLSTFVTLGLIAAFKRADLKARQDPFYSPRPYLGKATVSVSVAAIAGAVLHTWVMATHWAG